MLKGQVWWLEGHDNSKKSQMQNSNQSDINQSYLINIYKSQFDSEEIAASDLFECAIAQTVVAIFIVPTILHYLSIVCLHALHHTLDVFFLLPLHVEPCFLVQLVELFQAILFNPRYRSTRRDVCKTIFLELIALVHERIALLLLFLYLYWGKLFLAFTSKMDKLVRLRKRPPFFESIFA